MQKNFKTKIFNDPIYGFITVNDELIFQLIEHPYFQRLRRIKQLGLTHMVYPGALHTRFHHAMGATYLMGEAIETLRSKGVDITNQEELSAKAAILLHDIGHGPFSHALEHSIVSGVTHEFISSSFMAELNKEMNGKLETAIQIFNNTYSKPFLHQLVSGQLDVDRLDYLNRDSFFTGVSEGVISWDRIIKTLNVSNDKLVVDLKGIYSIEKFIVARRLMYWQVYLHKTVLSAEHLLVKILKRAKELYNNGVHLFATPAFEFFLQNNFTQTDFKNNPILLQTFANLDDNDIYASIKVWQNHNDFILSTLCTNILNRKLFRIELQNNSFDENRIKNLKQTVAKQYGVTMQEADYFVFTDSIKNSAYNPKNEKINILQKDGSLIDIAQASDQLNIQVLSNTVEKFFICYPKTECN
ncbi:MAG: HD domain-containing protein [Bacteroidia bacterium]|nr:HD domain-containing protein [Bacteroidia bacterium]